MVDWFGSANSHLNGLVASKVPRAFWVFQGERNFQPGHRNNRCIGQSIKTDVDYGILCTPEYFCCCWIFHTAAPTASLSLVVRCSYKYKVIEVSKSPRRFVFTNFVCLPKNGRTTEHTRKIRKKSLQRGLGLHCLWPSSKRASVFDRSALLCGHIRVSAHCTESDGGEYFQRAYQIEPTG